MIYTADWLLPVSSEPIEHGQMLVRDGKIIAVGRNLDQQYLGEKVRKFSGCAILPGFVNSHTHIEFTSFRGRFDGLPFFSWLCEMGTAGRLAALQDFELGSEMACKEIIAGGTTTICEISTKGISPNIIRQSGLRAVVYYEITALFRADEDAERLVHKTFDSMSEHSDLVTFGISPHAIYTVAPPLLELSAKLAEERDIRLAIHVAESNIELEFMQKRGEIADFYKQMAFSWKAVNVSPVEYLRDRGILSPRTIAVHCVHVNAKDLDILASTGTSVAHCPKSNAKLGHGIAPVREMLHREIPIGLGTDSAASNDKLDMFEEMRAAVLFAREREHDPMALSAAEALKMATLDGATVLGLADKIGSLEPGKDADFIAVDLKIPPTTGDPVSHIVFCCGTEHVRYVAIQGRSLIGGKIPPITA